MCVYMIRFFKRGTLYSGENNWLEQLEHEEDKNPRRSSTPSFFPSPSLSEFVGPQKEQMKFPFLLGAVGAVRFNPRQRI